MLSLRYKSFNYKLKRGDTIEQTLQREVEEETGITELLNIQEVGMVMSNIRIPIAESDVGLILGIFNCQIDDKSEIKISFEHLEYKWFSPQEAAELLKVKYPNTFTNKVASL